MKPFDPKGEYTPAEVKAALAGVDGTRQLSFRYDRLDKNNNFIEEIDNVQSCTIENNAFADIKRTAKLDILDTGSLNYLQDRIKPYVRIAMPTDDTYADAVETLDPAVWWKLDDTNKPELPLYSSTLPLDNSYNSQATALVLDPTKRSEITFQTSVSDATVRDAFWQSYYVTDSEPLMFAVLAGNPVVTTVYTADKLDGELTQIMVRPHPSNGVGYDYIRFPFPERGYYFVKVEGQNALNVNVPSVHTSRPARLEDSSNNRVNATGSKLNLGSAPVLNDGGKSLSIAPGTPFSMEWGVDNIDVPLRGGIAVNYWAKPVISSTGNFYVDVEAKTSNMAIHVMYYDQGPNQADSAGFVRLFIRSLNGTNYYSNFPWEFSKYRGAAHMFTFVVEEDLSTAIYIDSVRVATGDARVDPDFDYSSAMQIESINTIDAQFSGAGTISMDDMSIYTKPLKRVDIATLYAKGTQLSNSSRSGYVEWPQGVFLLSSPTRTMQEGNTVVLGVEAYDQLLVLSEDSYDARVSFPAGTLYTQAVKSVLNSTGVTSPDTDKLPAEFNWGITIGTSHSNGTYTLTDNNANNYDAAILSPKYTQALEGFELSAQIAIGNMERLDFLIYSDDPSITNPTDAVTGFTIRKSTNVVGIAAPKSNNTFVIRASYDPVAHKFLRVRENAGVIYYEASANGTTWSILQYSQNTFQPGTGIYIQIIGSANAATNQTATVSSLKLVSKTLVENQITSSALKMPTAMEWEPGTTKLKVVNDLLDTINYESAWFDEDGIFIGIPYVSPSDRTPEFRYATDSSSVITGDVDQTIDLFKIPNKWTLVVSEADRPAITSTYVNSNPLSPTSTVSRGRTIVDFRTEQGAADQLTLDAKAARLAFEASQVYEKINFSTGLMPIHSNGDVYTLIVDGLVVNSKYSETSWSMELANGATMDHEVRRITQV